MDSSSCKTPKRMRIRSNPIRRWTLEEEKAIVGFLMQNPEIEKPTAQVYYKRFMTEKKIEAEWKLVRAKVRNMRMNYNKAKTWEATTNADTKTVKSTLLRICRFFYEFDSIFGDRFVETAGIEDSSQSSALYNDYFEIAELDLKNPVNSQNPLESSAVENESVASSSKSIYFKTAVAEIIQIQAEMVRLIQQKVDQDLSLREKEISIKEMEVAVKEKELKLKEKELLIQEQLKIRELEMKERLAMEEFKLKYK